MKHQRKNKTNQSVIWPTTSFFTIRELHALNPTFVLITLRVRLANSISNGEIVEVGSIPGVKGGRPNKVFSFTPVSKGLLDEAEKNGITLVDRAREKLINVVSVNTTSPSTILPSASVLAIAK